MKDLEIIDAHIHLVRTVEEECAYFQIPGRRICDRYGTPEKALSFMDMEMISKVAFMILIPRQFRGPLFDKAKLAELDDEERQKAKRGIRQQIAPIIREFNEWGCQIGQKYPRLASFVCLSDDLGDTEGMVEELLLRVHQGAKGVKLHPGIFSLRPDDEVMWPVYEKCQELGLPVVADSGPFPVSHILTAYASPIWFKESKEHIEYGEPKNFERVLQDFPRLTLVLAHLGSVWWDERVGLAEKYPNVYFDTAQGFSAVDMVPHHPHRGLAEDDAVRVIRSIGIKRVMFGTDFPGVAWQPQVEQILRLPLTDQEKHFILVENAKNILKL